MKVGTWSVAFTIAVCNPQIDFTELPQQNQIEILSDLVHGITNGELVEHDETQFIKALSYLKNHLRRKQYA